MIRFEDFFEFKKGKAKVKFNMNAGNRGLRALDLLLSDDYRWIEKRRIKRQDRERTVRKKL